MGIGCQPGQRVVSFRQARGQLHGFFEFGGSLYLVSLSGQVQWLGGQREVFPGGKANLIVVLTEGSGSPAAATAKPAPGSRP
ncbi:MAG: hypothetical protein LAO18_06525 [Acidobacteriia bacterium]|nr:hypothetical protein [Terriglobia bacterium]